MLFKANCDYGTLIKKFLLFVTFNPRPGITGSSFNRKKIFLAMKITTILLLSASLTASAGGFAQQVTLTAKNMRLEKVFKEIRRQTGYVFFYDANLLKKTRPVSIDVKDGSVEEVLRESLEGKPLDFSIERKTITIVQKESIASNKGSLTATVLSPAPPLFQQIKGTVKDERGNPLAAVSVVVKGTKRGTSTAADGSFSIDANVGDVLEFSMVGYKKRSVTVGANTNISIEMEIEAVAGNEVVIVGYGTQKKVDLTGAVSQVSGERLQDRPITNVADGLQGVMANVNVTTTGSGGTPGASKSINVRGYTGLGSSASPLILVDGVPGDINSINPSDIESITVLKDAASSAIYGSRAPYGVILIKTKQGKKGQHLTVSLNSNFSNSQPLDVPKMMNSLQFAEIYNDAFVNAGQNPWITDATIERIKKYMADPKNTPPTIVDPNNPAQWLSWNNANANNDWFKVYLKKWSPSQQHNLSVSGGSENITYFLGLGYNKKNGLFNYFHDNFDRYNYRGNVTAKINKWMSLSLKSSFAQKNSNAPYAGADIGYNWFHQIPRRFPMVPVKDPNGHYTNHSYIPEIMNGGRDINTSNDSWITTDLILTPLKGLTIDANYSYNYYTGLSQQTQLPFTYYLADNTPTTNGMISQLWKSNTTSHYHTYNVYGSYEKQVGEHYFKALLGYQQEYKSSESLSGHNSNLYNLDLPSLALTYGNNYSASDNMWAWATEGLFMRFNYNYKEKYLFEFNGRYDGSSLFPSDRRYAYFPSFSVGYNVAKENFWKPLANVLTTLKLRASYGTLGDVSTLLNQSNYYPYQNTLVTQPPASTNWEFAGGRQPYVQVGGLTDPNITWAKPSMLDFGLDIAALDNRLQGTFDWYRRKTKDLFGPAQSYPGVLGVNPPQKNNASIQTTGFDLTIGWQDKVGKLGYNASFVLSNYKGVVLSYPNPSKIITDWYDGAAMGAIWGYTAVDLFQSQDEIAKSASQTKIYSNWKPGDVHYQDLNGDGKIDWGKNTVDSSGDLSIIGNSTPQFSYGFNFGLNWKGFDLNGFVQGIGKREFFSTSNYFWGITGNQWQGSPLTSNLNRYTPDNPNGYFPNYYMSGEMNKNMQTSTRYLLNAAYLRMKNLQIGYTVPASITNKAHISRLRVYGSVENLFTIAPGLHNKFQVDPEVLISDSKIYPIQRTFSLGINLNLQ